MIFILFEIRIKFDVNISQNIDVFRLYFRDASLAYYMLLNFHMNRHFRNQANRITSTCKDRSFRSACVKWTQTAHRVVMLSK